MEVFLRASDIDQSARASRIVGFFSSVLLVVGVGGLVDIDLDGSVLDSYGEARNRETVGILDSNCDPDDIAYGIPGNDDAIRSVGLLTRVIADAVADGIKQRHAVKTGTEAEVSADAEPLAEWEQELLKQSEVQAQDAPAEESVAAAEEKPAEEAPAAESSEETTLASSIGMGIFAALACQAMYTYARTREVSSEISASDLRGRTAEVVIPFGGASVGKASA